MPNEGELLYVYLVISEHAISSVLLGEVDGEQCPIYLVNKTFTDCQIRYLLSEKLILVLILTSLKLMHYFQAHPIAVYTEFPLTNIFPKADLFSHLSKFAIELGQSNIKFLPRVAIIG